MLTHVCERSEFLTAPRHQPTCQCFFLVFETDACIEAEPDSGACLHRFHGLHRLPKTPSSKRAPHQSKRTASLAPYASTDVDATLKTDQLLRPRKKIAGADMQMPPRGFEEDMRRSYCSVVGPLERNSLPSCSSSQGLPLHPPSSLPATQVTKKNVPANHNTKHEARRRSAAFVLSNCNADSLLLRHRTRSKHSRPLGTSMVAHLHGFHRLHGLANKVSGATSPKPLPPARHEQASKRLLPLQVAQCSTLLLLGAFILLHCEETCKIHKSQIVLPSWLSWPSCCHVSRRKICDGAMQSEPRKAHVGTNPTKNPQRPPETKIPSIAL